MVAQGNRGRGHIIDRRRHSQGIDRTEPGLEIQGETALGGIIAVIEIQLTGRTGPLFPFRLGEMLFGVVQMTAHQGFQLGIVIVEVVHFGLVAPHKLIEPERFCLGCAWHIILLPVFLH